MIFWDLGRLGRFEGGEQLALSAEAATTTTAATAATKATATTYRTAATEAAATAYR